MVIPRMSTTTMRKIGRSAEGTYFNDRCRVRMSLLREKMGRFVSETNLPQCESTRAQANLLPQMLSQHGRKRMPKTIRSRRILVSHPPFRARPS